MSHRGPVPFPCLKYPGKKTTILIDYASIHNKDHPNKNPAGFIWF